MKFCIRRHKLLKADSNVNTAQNVCDWSAPSVSQSVFTITEKALVSTLTFKTLLRHYAKRGVDPMETGGLVSIVSYSRPSLMIIASRTQFNVVRPWGQGPFSIVS